MPGLSYQNGAENKFTYNGKELEDEFGLDWYHYGARYYDPVVGRWWAVDPADEFYTPYSFVGGNPIMFIDPDGRVTTPPFDMLITWARLNAFHFKNALETGNQSSKDIIVGQMKAFLYVDIAIGVMATGGLAAPYIIPATTNPTTSTVVSTGLKLADQANLAQAANEALVITNDYLNTLSIPETFFEGGLVLYKWNRIETINYIGNPGDYMLVFKPDLGTELANWTRNEAELLKQMDLGRPIFDSFIDSNGELLDPEGGFLLKERNTLINAEWKYNSSKRAWLPPHLQE